MQSSVADCRQRRGSATTDCRAGQILLFTTLSLSALFALTGLTVDLGYSYYKKTEARAAADAAAQGAVVWASNNGSTCGAGGVVCGATYNCASPPVSPPTTALQAGCVYAQANGFTNTGNQSVSLIANNTAPPNEGGNSPSYWVQASVSETVPHWFLFWSGFHSSPVAAEAIAGLTNVTPGSCVYILKSGNVAGALTASGSASLSGSGCGIYVNSSSASAINVSGSSSTSATGSVIDVVGSPGYVRSGAATISPVPTASSPIVADPLASLPAPTVGACDVNNYSLSGSNTATINPGVYCNGINTSGSSQLTLNPGIYVLNGGGLNTSGSSKLTAPGVVFFLTGQGGHTPAGINLSGSAALTLTPPTSGPYQGILFYQDRGITYAAANSISGSVTVATVSGTFYFPTTSVSLSGSMGANKMALICQTLNISGSATFQKDATGASTGLVTKSSALIQ